MIESISWTAFIRGLHLAAMLSMLGILTLDVWILPAALIVPERLRRRLVWQSAISAAVALVAGAVWFVFQAAAIAEADTISAMLTALPLVAGQTRFGMLLTVRLALLLMVTLLGIVTFHPARLSRYSMIALVGAALGLQGAIGHAGATEGTTGIVLMLCETLHLFAAGVWLGALIPFALAVSALSTADAAALCERFSPVGLACVMVLAGTGLAQGLELIGTLPALVGTGYGHLILFKAGFFLLALALAAVNRLWLTDRLLLGLARARRQLLISMGLEALAGLIIIGAAALLASTVPGVHDTPVWPFSLNTVSRSIQLPATDHWALVAHGRALGAGATARQELMFPVFVGGSQACGHTYRPCDTDHE